MVTSPPHPPGKGYGKDLLLRCFGAPLVSAGSRAHSLLLWVQAAPVSLVSSPELSFVFFVYQCTCFPPTAQPIVVKKGQPCSSDCLAGMSYSLMFPPRIRQAYG